MAFDLEQVNKALLDLFQELPITAGSTWETIIQQEYDRAAGTRTIEGILITDAQRTIFAAARYVILKYPEDSSDPTSSTTIKVGNLSQTTTQSSTAFLVDRAKKQIRRLIPIYMGF